MKLRLLFPAIFLSVLWLLMSGIYKPLIIGFGAISVLLVMIITRRMDQADGDRPHIGLSMTGAIKYWFWLMGEIAKSNWVVTKTILLPDMPIRQHMFRIPFSQNSDLGQVIFANSITLTPGTITVETEQNEFLVHALSYSKSDPADLADMNDRVAGIENGVTS